MGATKNEYGIFGSMYVILGLWSYYAYGDYPLEYLYAVYIWLIISFVLIFIGACLLIVRARKLRAEKFV